MSSSKLAVDRVSSSFFKIMAATPDYPYFHDEERRLMLDLIGDLVDGGSASDPVKDLLEQAIKSNPSRKASNPVTDTVAAAEGCAHAAERGYIAMAALHLCFDPHISAALPGGSALVAEPRAIMDIDENAALNGDNYAFALAVRPDIFNEVFSVDADYAIASEALLINEDLLVKVTGGYRLSDQGADDLAKAMGGATRAAVDLAVQGMVALHPYLLISYDRVRQPEPLGFLREIS